MNQQRTIKKPVTLAGPGLFSGEPGRLKFCPAPANSGVKFVRQDLPAPLEIKADISCLIQQSRRNTAIGNGPAGIATTEHIMSAIWGLGIDNLTIEMSGNEIPAPDASALPFANALMEAGIEDQGVDTNVFVIDEPVTVAAGDAMLTALPGTEDCLDILYDLDYSNAPAIGRQVVRFRLGKDDYISQIAPARTFLLEEEAKLFQSQGMGKHLTTKDILVVSANGPIDNALRFPDEYARHKISDMIGDLALLGKRIKGRIVAFKSGHDLNHDLVLKLIESKNKKRPAAAIQENEPVLDIRKIMRLLPHRYPFLMIDRVLEIDGDQRAVAIKNVTINEPFFMGHYPNLPIMPGVMILEAMAQLSGILLSRRLEHTGKVALLLSMDRVKMRRPVRPGDQLMLHAEAINVRPRTGHCQCKAMVGQEIAAEAEIKFMLVDAEPV